MARKRRTSSTSRNRPSGSLLPRIACQLVSLFSVFEQLKEWASVNAFSDLHRAEFYTTAIQSLEDVIDARVIAWVELLNDCGAENRVIQLYLIPLQQLLKGFSLPARIDVLQPKRPIVKAAFEESYC